MMLGAIGKELSFEIVSLGMFLFSNVHFTRCEVRFPRAPRVRTQESNYDLRIQGKS